MNFSGGLNYIDLKSSVGAVVRTVAARRAEGVFSVRAEFTPCGRYVLYYHSKRRTLREETVALISLMCLASLCRNWKFTLTKIEGNAF